MKLDILSNPFIISRETLIYSDDFNYIYKLSDGYLYSNKNDTIFKYHFKNYNIYIIGYILDIRNGDLDKQDIAKNITNSHHDKDLLLDTLDYLGGRYVLLIDNGHQTEIYTDATVLRPIFHWKNTVFASHEILLREIVNENYEANIKKFKQRLNGYLDYSNSNDIYKLNPNLVYILQDKSMNRIFPRKHYQIKSVEEVLNKITPYFEEQVKWLNNSNRKLYLSLTGGFDSKVTLALTKEVQRKLTYFTYMKNSVNMTKRSKWIYGMDKRIVDKLRFNLNLNHEYIHIDEIDVDETAIKALANHTTSNHAYKLGIILGETLEKDSLHIRSTLYELGKTPYYSKFEKLRSVNEMFEVSTQWMPKTIDESEALTMFNSYLKRNDLISVQHLNYHLPFIIYWETRMGNWHGNLTQETDLNHETFIIINNRLMLDNFISLSLSDRKNATLFHELIKRKWPILNYFIPNTDSSLEDKLNKKNIEEKTQNSYSLNNKGIVFKQVKNIDLIFKEDFYYIKPLANTKLKDEEHTFELTNTLKNNQRMEITSFYSRVSNRIKITVDNEELDVTELVSSKKFVIKPNQRLTISYKYWKNTELVSWYNAGRIKLSFELEK